MSLSNREIKEILAILEDSGWDEAEVSVGDVTLSVSKGPGRPLAQGTPAGGAPASETAPPPPPSPRVPATADASSGAAVAPAPAGAGADPAAGGEIVSSPSVGVFWRAPEPGAPPFVEQGAAVEAGQPLCIIEIMKLMQQVIAETAGTVTAIHIENGDQVEFGTPLFSIAPASA